MPRIWREHGSFTVSIPPSCTPYAIKPGVILTLNPTLTTTLTERIVATPTCLFDSFPTPTNGAEGDWEDFETLDLNSLRDPFYASSIPMAYSIAATTVLAYVLLILLFLPSPPNARPWLQKVATMMVCICLTIAFAETTDVLSEEYNKVGSSVYSLANEARQVREQVVAGVVMKTGRVISDLFLWLAQVQTLIRLFPREREKAIIKWAGFALILLDTTFSVLQAFVSPLASTESFLDAIPALSYLFQLTLSMLYASCVIYYSIVKRRYAWFYRPLHPFQKMTEETGRLGARSIILVAVMGLVAVLTPIVFFIVDIAQKDLAGWGDYIRWVGAASASVVVWEWVDRIEGLEREERKDGVLGREVFEEDEEVRYYNHRDAGDDDTDRHDGGDRGGVLGRGRRRRRERDSGGDGVDVGRPLSFVDTGTSVTGTGSSMTYNVHMRQLSTNEHVSEVESAPPSSPSPRIRRGAKTGRSITSGSIGVSHSSPSTAGGSGMRVGPEGRTSTTTRSLSVGEEELNLGIPSAGSMARADDEDDDDLYNVPRISTDSSTSISATSRPQLSTPSRSRSTRTPQPPSSHGDPNHPPPQLEPQLSASTSHASSSPQLSSLFTRLKSKSKSRAPANTTDTPSPSSPSPIPTPATPTESSPFFTRLSSKASNLIPQLSMSSLGNRSTSADRSRSRSRDRSRNRAPQGQPVLPTIVVPPPRREGRRGFSAPGAGGVGS